MLSAAVVLFGVATVGIPLGPLLLYGAASETVAPSAGPGLTGIAGLAAPIAIVVGLGALLILVVQIPLLVIATVGGRVAGEPITLRQALRRSRQVFLSGLVATIVIGVATYVPGAFVQVLLFAALGPTQLAIGLEILVRAALTAPWVYVLPGIVLGGVGTGESIRRSWQLVRYRGRIALTIALLGAVGQTVVTAAENDVVGPILTVFGFAGAGTTVPPDLQPVAAIGLLVVSAVLLASLLFGFQLVQFAPQASGFYVLTRYAAGLEAARGEQPEPLFQRRALVFYAAGIVAGLVLLVNTLPLLKPV